MGERVKTRLHGSRLDIETMLPVLVHSRSASTYKENAAVFAPRVCRCPCVKWWHGFLGHSWVLLNMPFLISFNTSWWPTLEPHWSSTTFHYHRILSLTKIRLTIQRAFEHWLFVGCMLCTYSISQEICTLFCCALLCCGYAIVHNEFTWSIYPYSSGLLCWHWGNR